MLIHLDKKNNAYTPFIQNVICIGAGENPVSEYRSVIFYHVGKPEWVETIKVNIGIYPKWSAFNK